MRGRAAFWLAWSIAGLSMAMFFAVFVLTFLVLLAGDAPYSGAWNFLGDLLTGVPFLAFPVVGALIASRRPENAIGWISLITGLFWMLFGVIDRFGWYEAAGSGQSRPPLTLDALSQGLWALPVGLLGVYMILLFPDGKLPSRRWRPLAWFAGTLIALICVSFPLAPGPLGNYPGYSNPLGQEWLAWFADVAVFLVLPLPVCILASALSLIFRYRRSSDEVREQIKWLAFAACLIGSIYLGGLLAQLIFAPASLQTGGVEPRWSSLINSLGTLSYAGVPVAIGFAVLKYRLYDIDIIINRALVYGSLTVSLALVYFGGVAGTQAAFRALTGQEQQPQLAVVISTLAIAALFGPLRRRIQSAIDRRFYRRKYDASRILAAYGTRLRDEVDLRTLSDDLLEVVRETVQPAHASLWLRPSDGSPRAEGRKT